MAQKILRDREVVTVAGVVIADVTLDDVQPTNKRRLTGAMQSGDSTQPVVWDVARGWMDRIMVENSMFFGW